MHKLSFNLKNCFVLNNDWIKLFVVHTGALMKVNYGFKHWNQLQTLSRNENVFFF